MRQKLIEKKRVFDYSMFLEPQKNEADIEDLLPTKLYIDAFNKTYAKELNTKKLVISELEEHPRTVERINKWLIKTGILLLKDGGYNHYRVAQTILPMLSDKSLGSKYLAIFEKLFKKINDQF